MMVKRLRMALIFMAMLTMYASMSHQHLRGMLMILVRQSSTGEF
ncbi:hypothetical protein ACWN8R_06910 [Pediococcus acidilactici]|nr:hypothetical protein [Pediococcus acidilactici]